MTNRLRIALASLLVAAGQVCLPPSTAAPAPSRIQACEVSEVLVNSCRPWLGARAEAYPEAESGFQAQTEYHEQRIGKQLDIVHTFAGIGDLPLESDDERELAQREGTYLYQNWKPTADWSEAGGDNPEVDELIDDAAANIKAIAPKKIFLTLHHEPENDVSSDPACDTDDEASAGTAEEYVAMWRNVRGRFDTAGVGNVVWVMDYMNYARWDCLVPKVYPGDEYVDWVMFNGYGRGSSPDFATNVGRFYDLLSDWPGADAVAAKPWGIVEWGIRESTQQQAASYYDQAVEALEADRFPKLEAYLIFDSPGTHDEGGLRVAYDDAGDRDDAEQRHYTDFANSPAFDEP